MHEVEMKYLNALRIALFLLNKEETESTERKRKEQDRRKEDGSWSRMRNGRLQDEGKRRGEEGMFEHCVVGYHTVFLCELLFVCSSLSVCDVSFI